MNKYFIIILLLAGSIIIVQPEYLTAAPEDIPSNILLISVDSLRADHLGCYGYRRDTSPIIDDLAASGALFENTISTTSWTLPAHISLLTSMDISVHGVANDGLSLHSGVGTIAQELKKNGYATACFCSSPYMSPAFGFARGFDLYRNLDLEDKKIVDTVLPTPEQRDGVHGDITSPRITDLAIEWIRSRREEPFFLFLHFWDVHYDYIPPAPYDRRFDPDYRGDIDGRDYWRNEDVNPKMAARDLEHIIALYDGEIAWVDHHLGLIFSELKKLGLFDRTLIMVTADHGDEFFEHGGKGHRSTLFDEVVRIPLIIHSPGGNGGGRKIPGQVSIIDIAPTILELTGVTVPGWMQGISLAPACRGEALPGNRHALLELGNILKALRTDTRKLLFNALALHTIILDLEKDPGESQQTLVTDPPEWNRINRAFYERILQDQELARKYRGGETGAPVKLDAEQVKKLRDLGYLQ
ncbi:MAG: sulfatase [PVC group bacterium]